MQRPLVLAALCSFAVVLVSREGGTARRRDMRGGDSLEVRIEPRSGSALAGTASFRETPGERAPGELLSGGVRVVLDIRGASPGKHGVHIHEKGDCSAPGAESAGEHFSPDANPHDLPPTEKRHLGDLGNVEVGTNGVGHLQIDVSGANLHPDDPRSFAGRAIIVHADDDDGSQPSGNAGKRIGCGEIRR